MAEKIEPESGHKLALDRNAQGLMAHSNAKEIAMFAKLKLPSVFAGVNLHRRRFGDKQRISRDCRGRKEVFRARCQRISSARDRQSSSRTRKGNAARPTGLFQ